MPASWELCAPKLLVVEDLSRRPSRIGGCSGDDVAELIERVEACRKRFMPGSAKDKDAFANDA